MSEPAAKPVEGAGEDSSLTPAERGRIVAHAEATAVLFAIVLALAKVAVFLLTGAISILASAADSVLDVAASSINWFAVRAAAEPPDEEHSYGHGKFEAVAGVFQAGVVAAAAVYLLYSSLRRVVEHQPVENVPIGIAVMLGSVVASIFIAWNLRRAARRTGSVALAGDALHYTSDILANLATVAALGLVAATGEPLWDPLLALILTVYLLRAAWGVLKPALDILVDRQLSDAERQVVEHALQESAPPEVVGYYRLRTRTSGPRSFVDVRVVFHPEIPFPRIHDITEQMEAAVVSRFRSAEVVIHPEPLGAHGLPPESLAWRRESSPESGS